MTGSSLFVVAMILTAGQAPQGAAPAPASQAATQYSRNPQANALFLRGRELFAQSDPRAGGRLANAREAIRLYQQAVAADPRFALAYVELSRAWLRLGYSDPDGASAAEIMPPAREALRRAVAIDPNLPEAHAAAAAFAYSTDFDWPTAEREYRAAIRLQPDNAIAHGGYGAFLSSMGRFEEAIAELQRADALAPTVGTKSLLCRTYYSQRRFDLAEAQCRRSIAVQDNVIARLYLGFTNIALGRLEEGVAELERTSRFTNNGGAWAALAYGYAMAGRREEALRLVQEITTTRTRGGTVPYRIAAVHLALGDRDRAIEWLRRDYAERGNWMNQLKVDPVMDPLRSDPRFRALMRAMRFDRGAAGPRAIQPFAR